MTSAGAALAAGVAAMLVLRQPLIVILLAASAFVHVAWGQGRLDFVAEDIWVALDKELILSVPLYLLCGQVMARGGTARRLVDIVRALTPRVPGGLGVACALACALDASISGSSIVTMLAIGSIMVPQLLQAGYERRFVLGSVMAGGTIGIIIPPSIPMILYGIVTECSIVDLFKAGVGPGLLLTAAFAAYAVWRHRHMPTSPVDWGAVVRALRAGAWALLLPVIMLGGIYSGWFSITEAAAVALAYAVLIEAFVHRELRAADFRSVLVETARMSGALFPIIALALSLSRVLTEHQVPAMLLEWVQQWIATPLGFMVAVNFLLLVVGMFVTTDVAILLLAPLLVPIAHSYGYDKVLFGIIMLLNLEIGYLTPPVGMNLIVAMGAFRQPFGELCRAVVPFIVIMLGCLALVIWQPWIAMWLVRR